MRPSNHNPHREQARPRAAKQPTATEAAAIASSSLEDRFLNSLLKLNEFELVWGEYKRDAQIARSSSNLDCSRGSAVQKRRDASRPKATLSEQHSGFFKLPLGSSSKLNASQLFPEGSCSELEQVLLVADESAFASATSLLSRGNASSSLLAQNSSRNRGPGGGSCTFVGKATKGVAAPTKGKLAAPGAKREQATRNAALRSSGLTTFCNDQSMLTEKPQKQVRQHPSQR